MHALLRESEQLHPSWRHPAGISRYFDSDYARELIEKFNTTGELESLNRLLLHCEPLLRSQFEYRATTKYVPLAESMSTARVKIWRSLRLFDPARGSSFSFISRIASSVAMSAVAASWQHADRCVELDSGLGDRLPAPPVEESHHTTTDLAYRIKAQTRTTCTEEPELRAQRCIVTFSED
jgi:hypothetical protein